MAQLATISNLSSISNEDNVNLRVCVIGVLQETSIPWGKKIEVVIADSTGATKLVWFNPSEGQLEKLKGEMPVALFDIIKKPTELVGTRKSKIIALSTSLSCSEEAMDAGRKIMEQSGDKMAAISIREKLDGKLGVISAKIILIGKLREVTIKASGNSAKLRSVCIADLSGMVKLTLWEPFCLESLTLGQIVRIKDCRKSYYNKQCQLTTCSSTVVETVTEGDNVHVLDSLSSTPDACFMHDPDLVAPQTYLLETIDELEIYYACPSKNCSRKKLKPDGTCSACLRAFPKLEAVCMLKATAILINDVSLGFIKMLELCF